MKRKLASLLVVASFALVLVVPIHSSTSHSFVIQSDNHGG